MTLFDLVAKLTLDSSQYESGIAGASSSASSFASKLGKGLGTAAKVGAAAITAVATAAVAVGTAISKSVAEVASYGDNIDKMSQKMNLSASAFQEWDAVMQHCGTSIESLQSSMKTLANAAETGSEAFTQLGISQEQIASMSNEELFSATITALQGVEDETERTYLAGKLLGRGATELGPLLNMSAEETQALKDRVHELGGVMSDEAIKAAAAYSDSLQDMKTALAGVKNSITSQFLPSFTKVMDGITEIFAGNADEGVELIADGIDKAIKQIDKMIPKVMDVGGKIISGIGKAIQKNLPKLLKSGTQIVQKLSTSIIQALPEMLNAGTQAVISLIQGITEELPTAIPQAVEAIMDIVDALTDPDNIVGLIDAGAQMIVTLADALIDSLPVLVERLPEIIENIVTGLVDATPKLVEAALHIISSLAEYLLNPSNWGDIGVSVVTIIGDLIGGAGGVLAGAAGTILGDLANFIVTQATGNPELGAAAEKTITEFTDGLVNNTRENLPKVANEAISTFVENISSAENMEDVFQAGAKLVHDFVRGIYQSMPELWSVLETILNITGNPEAAMALEAFGASFEAEMAEEADKAFHTVPTDVEWDEQAWLDSIDPVMRSTAEKALEEAKNAGVEAAGPAAQAVVEEYATVVEENSDVAGDAASKVGTAVSENLDVSEEAKQAGSNIIAGLVESLSSSAAVQSVTNAVQSLASVITRTLRSAMEISSPSKVMRRLGKFISEGLAVGITDGLSDIADAASQAASAVTDEIGSYFDRSKLISGVSVSEKQSGVGTPADPWAQVAKLLAEIRDNIGGDVRIDGNTLLGYVDSGLGTRSSRKARGVAWA